VLLNYVDRANLSTAAPLVQDELALSSSAIGLLLSSFFWVYMPAQLLGEWLVHRFDVRAVLVAGVVLWAGATVLTGLAGGFASILLLRLLLGLGECVTFPSWQLIVSRYTLEHERGCTNGFIGAGQGVGRCWARSSADS
jgi:MFS family permease